MLGPMTYGIAAASGGTVTYPLDGYDNIRAAYSVRRLLTSYEGNLLRIRRSSDSAEQDFSFDANGDLDTAAITEFIGGGSGFIVAWYDQSGNGNHATTTASAQQPAYVASSINSKPAPRFTSAGTTDTEVKVPDAVLASMTACTILTVFEATSSGTDDCLLGMDDSANGERYFLFFPRANGRLLFGFGSGSSLSFEESAGPYAYDDPHVLVGKASNGQPIQIYADGAEASYVSFRDNAGSIDAASFTNDATMGHNYFGTQTAANIDGDMPELIVIGAALSDGDRQALEASQASYFGVPLTNPSPGATVTRFGLVTDIHMADKDPTTRHFRDADEKLADAVTDLNADGNLDFTIMLGDFFDDYDGTDHDKALADLQQIEAVYDDLSMTRYYVHGANHGPPDLTKAQLIANTGATAMYYAFNVNSSLRVVVLDGAYYADDDSAHYDPTTFASTPWAFEDIYINPAQRTWLQGQLDDAPGEVLVCLHWALYPDSASGYVPVNAPVIREMLEDSGKVRHVLNGHRHENNHQIVNNICYHTFEAMTELAYPANSYGIVTYYDNGWIAIDGLDTRQETYSLGVPV